MKDIDFDELDKAVNSLMATTQPAAIPTPAPESTVAATPAAAPAPTSVPAPVSISEVVPVTVSQPTPAVERPVAPAARRGGRFMDMVHASSDMKQRESLAAPTNSREGLSITPRSEVPGPSPDQVVAVSQSPDTTPESAPAAMPDPIDLALNSQPDITTIEAEPAAMPAEPLVEPTPQAPIESPFLTDAKVEKRPLNAGTTDLSDLEAEMNSLQEDPDTYQESMADTESKKGDEPPVSPQIPELNSDLVAIESNDKIDITQATETAEAASKVEAPTVPLGAASIAQQYTTQASTGDQSHAAIYDSSQYPEPVAHPAKHKSGWLWVLWVVLLLGVGAGGALLLYNFGIIP